jgi:hypothetical protein
MFLVNAVPLPLYGPGPQFAPYHLQVFGVLLEHENKGYGITMVAAVDEKIFSPPILSGFTKACLEGQTYLHGHCGWNGRRIGGMCTFQR